MDSYWQNSDQAPGSHPECLKSPASMAGRIARAAPPQTSDMRDAPTPIAMMISSQRTSDDRAPIVHPH
jgi:hypothetical protein